MRALLAATVLALFLAPAAFAGGPVEDMPQQQMAIPQTKVVVVPPARGEGNGSTAIIVAAIGAAGLVGAAYFGARRKGN